MKNSGVLTIFILLISAGTSSANSARSWPMKTLKIHSGNGQFRADITAQSKCLIRQRNSRWPHVFVRKASFGLVSYPRRGVLVADSGQFVVTFGDCDADDAVVIYRRDGAVVRRARLADLLTEKDALALYLSTMGINWAAHHFIEDSGEAVVLRLRACVPRDPGCESFVDVAVDLRTGQPLQAKRHSLPQPRFFLSEDHWRAQEDVVDWSEPFCREGGALELAGNAKRLTAADLLSRLVLHPFQPYPKTAMRAGVTGTMFLETLVDGRGTVICVRLARGLPLGLADALQEAAMQWEFEPGTNEERLQVGALSIECQWVDRNHFAYDRQN